MPARPRTALAIVLLLALAGPLTVGSDAATRPNILLLYSDQHNASVLGCEGHADVLTPNLDRLAGGGVRFTRAYCQDGICMPSRIALMSGLYPRTLGKLENYADTTSVLERVTPLARILQQSGYATAAFGKRHLGTLGSNIDSGWDLLRSHMYAESPAENYVTWIESRGYARQFAQDWAAEWGRGPQGSSQAEARFPRGNLCTRPSALPDGMTMEAYTALNAVDFIKRQKHGMKPFFLWASFYRPHQPYTPLQRYLDQYQRQVPGWSRAWGEGRTRGGSIKKPGNMDQPIESLPPGLQMYRKKEGPAGWACADAARQPQIWRDHLAAYYALVTEIDTHIGAILAALDDAGLAENTIVVYTADHGDFVGAHGLCEKLATEHCVYEDTLRVPLVIRWPGHFRRGRVADDLVESVDLLPTLLEAAGVSLPHDGFTRPGRSLSGLLARGTPLGREYAVAENFSQIAVIGRRYKLGHWIDPIVVPRDYREFGDMLFDRRTDPLEMNNVFQLPGLAGERERLLSWLAEWEKRVPDTGWAELLRAKDPTVGRAVRIVPETGEGVNVRLAMDGRTVWRCVGGAARARYMYFRLSDPALRNGRAPSVRISIEYLDEGIGTLTLQYDSLDEASSGRSKTAARITLAGSRTWKTATVDLADARFAARCGAGDFRIAMPKETRLTVRSVEVE